MIDFCSLFCSLIKALGEGILGIGVLLIAIYLLSSIVDTINSPRLALDFQWIRLLESPRWNSRRSNGVAPMPLWPAGWSEKLTPAARSVLPGRACTRGKMIQRVSGLS